MEWSDVREIALNVLIFFTFPISVPIMLGLALLKYLRKPD